jgi:acetyltransferase-like isoleucine patch superfamily enzyme
LVSFPYIKVCGLKFYIEPHVKVTSFNYNERHLNIKLKAKAYIHSYVVLQGSGDIEIGENTFIGSFSVIGSNESVKIGNYVMIAQAVSIRDTDHKFDKLDIPMNRQGITTSPVVIKDDVWIGYGAVITKGVTIGKGAIIGANAVVTKDIPDYAIAVGIPAKVIRYRT